MAGWRRAIKPMFDRQKWKILRGDQVMIRSGKDAGQIGTVTKVIRDEKFPRVIIEGLNLVGSTFSFICETISSMLLAETYKEPIKI